jgi:hypothetical protein
MPFNKIKELLAQHAAVSAEIRRIRVIEIRKKLAAQEAIGSPSVQRLVVDMERMISTVHYNHEELDSLLQDIEELL